MKTRPNMTIETLEKVRKWFLSKTVPKIIGKVGLKFHKLTFCFFKFLNNQTIYKFSKMQAN